MKEGPSSVRRKKSRIYQEKKKLPLWGVGVTAHQDCTVLSIGTRTLLSGSPRSQRKNNFPRHYGFIGHSTVPPPFLFPPPGLYRYSSNHAHTHNSGAIRKPEDSSRCRHVSLHLFQTIDPSVRFALCICFSGTSCSRLERTPLHPTDSINQSSCIWSHVCFCFFSFFGEKEGRG